MIAKPPAIDKTKENKARMRSFVNGLVLKSSCNDKCVEMKLSSAHAAAGGHWLEHIQWLRQTRAKIDIVWARQWWLNHA